MRGDCKADLEEQLKEERWLNTLLAENLKKWKKWGHGVKSTIDP